MYREKPWTTRQYAGFATAEETNERFRYLLANGAPGLSMAVEILGRRIPAYDLLLIAIGPLGQAFQTTNLSGKLGIWLISILPDSKIVLLGSSRKPGEDREDEQGADASKHSSSSNIADDNIPF